MIKKYINRPGSAINTGDLNEFVKEQGLKMVPGATISTGVDSLGLYLTNFIPNIAQERALKCYEKADDRSCLRRTFRW